MKELVVKQIKEAIKESGYNVPVNFSVSLPPSLELGDFATNVAMLLASKQKISPKEIAEKIVSNLKAKPLFSKVEVALPGFINITLSPKVYEDLLCEILEKGSDFGRGGMKNKVSVEYISANPTGPIHIGNARGGPIGQAIGNLFEYLGCQVEREFYVNDVGGQIEKFGESLYYWYYKKLDERAEFPEGGYPGGYIKEISETIQNANKEKIESLKDRGEIIQFFTKEGLYYMVKSIREDAKLLGIEFDRWVNQSDFQISGKTEQVINELESKDATTEKEGALWYKNPSDPELEDKEDVLKKSDSKKSFTYFADDIAYHLDKYQRDYQLMVDVWGANHFGHIPRLKSALASLGLDKNKLKILLYQYVRLKNAGQIVGMSKRQGNFVTLRQIIESGVEPDAFKYFILSQNPNTPFDFDIKLAADTSEKNPVFYIKYAHARIASIQRKAREQGISEQEWNFALLTDPKEVALYKTLSQFKDLLLNIKEDLQIQSLPHYAYELASRFHDFYASCPVLTEDKKTASSRLALITAVKYILANSLWICGIESPEKM